MYIPERSGSCGELKMAVDWKCQSNFQDDIQKHPGRFLRFKDVKCFKWRCFQSVNIRKSIVPLQVSSRFIFSFIFSFTFIWVKISASETFLGRFLQHRVVIFSLEMLFFLTLASLRRRSLSVCVRIHPLVDGASPLMWGWFVAEWGGGAAARCSSAARTSQL